MTETETQKLLNKADILAADDLPYRDVPVPEWSGVVRVRTLTGAERDQYQRSVFQMSLSRDGKEVSTALRMEMADIRLAALCMVDAAGERLFALEEVEQLAGKRSKALDRVGRAARELNALSQQDVQELVGNSGATPSDDSGTDSQSSSGE